MNLAIITGASAGIGLATAERFLEGGYRVVNLSRRPCPLRDVVHMRCDLADPDLVDSLNPQLTPHLEAASEVALIHNASRLANDTAEGTPSADLRSVLEVNVVAINSLNRVAVPHMGTGSCILFVASTLAEKAVPGSYSYVITKHAQVGMMRALCQDLAGTGIHTACICPGFTDTEMLRDHVPPEAMDAVRGMSAFNRLIDPGEIAGTLFWATRTPVINGSVIHANLGQIER
ncbi:MAG: SDR family NAD(P)-dependent oxidoreductase [Gammaproteobacteria bacterium]|nr:SDR family NAD(P)-dependent oxidoreductase [Gammaproteobacteria bacterium]